MALPSLQDLKDVLRVQTTAEDTLLTALLARAQAQVQAVLDRPITAESDTFVIEDPRASALDPGGLVTELRPTMRLRIPMTPVAASPAPAVTDADGVTVDPTTYRLDRTTGVLTATAPNYWDNWPYTVVATVGLSTRDDYATIVEAALAPAILDVASDFYNRRNPAATDETAGGGVGVSYRTRATGGQHFGGIPQRVRELLEPFVRVTL